MPMTFNITRSAFIKGITAAGLVMLVGPPGKASAAAPKVAGRGANEVFQLAKDRCRAKLTLDYRLDDGAQMESVSQWVRQNGYLADSYVKGEFVAAFERKIAGLLGKEDACWMPTGTMAQLIALRLYADAAGNRLIGWHPSSHHLLHESDAYSHLHQLQSAVISPWQRPIQAGDVAAAPDVAAVSVEIPVRWIGQLQTWDELQALKTVAAERGIPLLMDGARLWEAQPFYARTYADICQGFDTVYVSFYKMIGAPGGAMLAGRRDFIRQARIWRHRQGGDIYQNLLYIAAAAMRIDGVLGQLAAYHKRALTLGRLLAEDERLIVMPAPPQTNLFRVFIADTPQALTARRDAIAKRTGIWVGDYFRPSRVPGITQVELQIGEGLEAISEKAAAAAFKRLLPDT